MSDVFRVRIVQPPPIPKDSSTTETLGTVQVTQVEPTRSGHVLCRWGRVTGPISSERLESVTFTAQVEWTDQSCLVGVGDSGKLSIYWHVVRLSSWCDWSGCLEVSHVQSLKVANVSEAVQKYQNVCHQNITWRTYIFTPLILAGTATCLSTRL